MQKHKLRFDKENLPKSARTARYAAYLQNSGQNKSRQPNLVKQQNTALISQNNHANGRAIRGKPNSYTNRSNPRLTTSKFAACTLSYAQALIDPWGVSEPPCIPDALTLPSWKFGARVRGNFIIGGAAGGAGNGYVIANPYQVTGDRGCVFYVNASTFVTNGFGGIGETGANFTATNDSPITAGSFVLNGNSFRTVGAGLAARYVGSEFNRGGQMLLYRDPQDQLLTNLTPAQLLSNKETTSVPVDRDWHYVVWKPSDFQDTSYTNVLQSATLGQFCMLVYILGGVSGTTFEFDFIQWFEVVGRDLPNETPSVSDPLGYAVVKSAVAVPQPPDSPKSNFSRFLSNMAGIANETLSFVGTGVRAISQGATLLSNIGLL